MTDAERVEILEAALMAAVGNMMNAKFDLECGTTKAFAAHQIEAAIQRATTALALAGDEPPESRVGLDPDAGTRQHGEIA